MWQMYENETDNELHAHDCVYGKLIDFNKDGIYVRLENGETAFAYFSRLEYGTRVLCSVLRKARGMAYMNVSIDAVYGVDREAEYAREDAYMLEAAA